MFAGGLLNRLDADRRQSVLARTVELCRPRAWQQDRWELDYVRLRIRAVRRDGTVA